MSLTLITPPAAEPVSLAEVRLQCRIDADNTAEDALLGIYIKAARVAAEHELQRALIDQSWELRLDAFPVAEFALGQAQASSITTVQYIDTAGSLQTLSSEAYSLNATTIPGWVVPAAGAAWPATADVINAVRVRFVAGYGATSAAVPDAVRVWIMLTAAALYKQREALDMNGRATTLPGRFVDALLDPFRVYL